MAVAYVDSSCLVAIAFEEPAAERTAARLADFARLVSSNLLEAELRAACLREGVRTRPVLLDRIAWILPNRPLEREIGEVLSLGYLRGADVWHLACALYLTERPFELTFMTLDDRQSAMARRLGFAA